MEKAQRVVGLLLTLGVVCAAIALVAGSGQAVQIKGTSKAECYARFDVSGTATSSPITCTDGDTSCDQDGAANGSCRFNVEVCVNQTDNPSCTAPASLTKLNARPSSLLPNLPGLTGAGCGSVNQVDIALKGKKHNKTARKKLHLTAVAASGTKPKKGNANLVLICKAGTGTTTSTTIPPNCADNPGNGPKQLLLTTASSGTDLDNGVTGISQNFPVVANSSLSFCLSGCDASTNSVCQATGATGAGTPNGTTFGAPLPLFASSVPVCVINRYRDTTIQGTADVKNGTFDATSNGQATPIRLLSDVYLTNPQQVCPRCINGKCNSGKNAGQACTVNGSVTVNNPPQANHDQYQLSSDCLPLPGDFQATLNIDLNLTSGTAQLTGSKPCPGQNRDDDCNQAGGVCNTPCSNPDSKGGLNQYCCSVGGTPCFPTSAASGVGAIIRTGSPAPASPAWPDPTYPKAAASGALVATFCEAATGSPSIDNTTGLPGPGALILVGKQCWIGNNNTPCP